MYGRLFICLLLVSMFLLRKPLKEELELFVDDYVHQREDLQETCVNDLYEAVCHMFGPAFVAEEMREKIKFMASSAVCRRMEKLAEAPFFTIPLCTSRFNDCGSSSWISSDFFCSYVSPLFLILLFVSAPFFFVCFTLFYYHLVGTALGGRRSDCRSLI